MGREREREIVSGERAVFRNTKQRVITCAVSARAVHGKRHGADVVPVLWSLHKKQLAKIYRLFK